MGVLLAAVMVVTALLCLPPCVPTTNALMRHPSAESLRGCRTTCGALTFGYPFGIGPARCFRNTDFKLICNHTRLFLNDGVTEVRESIDPARNGFLTALPPPVVTYVNPDNDTFYAIVEITGCDFTAYIQNKDGDVPLELCPFIPCSNTNNPSCSQNFKWNDDLQLKFVRVNVVQRARAKNPNPSPPWDRINITAINGDVLWAVRDQRPTCDACASEHSHCEMDNSGSGYSCTCDEWYRHGNPYVVGGCSADNGYNPILRGEMKCKQSCGTIPIEFPFGLEEGCYARKEFQLSCTNINKHPVLAKPSDHVAFNVTHIDINKGLIGISGISGPAGEFLGSPLYSATTTANNVFIWAVANLTCQHARLNRSGYACMDSTLSECVGVNLTGEGGYIGYRCQCKSGFNGNPYIPNGCKDVNECKTMPGICSGKICHNTEGGHYCSRLTSLQVGLIIGFCVCFGILLVCLSATVAFSRWRRDAEKKLRRKYFQKNQGRLLEQLISADENASDKTKVFSLEELEKATNGFDSARILGHGGHGVVYKGILSDQRVVAIKKPNTIEESKIDQFINEVAILSQINHRNIVRLFGCCLETEVPLLVYDFIPNGSLSQVLHSNTDSDFHLSWDHCLRMATEAAGALCYLHSAASMSVFHRDVKSSNILLDANYTAKVSDFGISRLVTTDQTHVSTCVQGTFGYLDPEYFHTGQLNEKSDVYSFGVVLLELLLRREPIITSESGSKQSLSMYFIEEFNTRSIKEIVSAQVSEEATEEEINIVASLAEKCLRIRGEERPTMKEVEMALQTMRNERLKSYRATVENDNLLHSRDQGISH